MEFLLVGIGASLQALLERFPTFVSQELDQISGVDDEIRKLRRTLLRIQGLVDDIDSQHLISYEEAWQAWLQDVTTLTFVAEDLLDETDLDLMGLNSEALEIVSSYFKSWSVPHKICEIQKKLEGMLDEIRPFMIRMERKKEPQSHATSQRLHTSSFIYEGSVIGRNEDKRQMVEMLLSIKGPKVSVIPIVGMGGIGKTTLAQLVYNDKDIESCFRLRIWISVSVGYDAVSITKSIDASVMEKRLSLSELDKIQVELQNIPKKKRFLLVLDDWNENISHNFWDVLRSLFSVGLSGSKVLVTTRSSVVSSFLTITDPYHLRPLSDEDCWELIAQEALLNEKVDEKKKLEVIGKKIAEKCEGLPLLAKTIGSICSECAKSEWQALLKKKLWDLPGYKTEVFPALRLSYNYLPARLKKCFAYCSIFPHKYEFLKDELVQLWAVEGFIQSQGVKRNEDIGNDYFDNLLSRCFFFEDKNNVNQFGQQVYSMHGLIHEMARLVSADFCIQMEDGMTHPPKFKNARRSSLLSQNIQSMTLKAFQSCRRLKTFMVFCESGLHDDKLLHALFEKFRCLRVLNLSNTGISELPDFDKLKCLRYLNVSKTKIWKLPESITRLYGLEILKIQECPKFLQLPKDIKKLVKLRHLDLDIKQLSSMPSELGKLTNLQTLSEFIVGNDEGFQIGELENMRNLQGKICITNLENVLNLKDAEKAKLNEKPYLASLELQWNDQEDSIKGQAVLGGLRPHCELQALKVIKYSGITFPDWLGNPLALCKLEEIELLNCKNCQFLPALSRLPALKSLRIEEFDLTKLEHQFCGLDINDEGFPSLEHLKFVDMPKLESWEGLTAKDMPCLGSLTIHDCPKLRSLPSLHFLSSLENLDIMRCPELRSLPVEGLPISLKKLLIVESDILKERCKEGGADWSKITAIQPIPKIEIDYEVILLQG